MFGPASSTALWEEISRALGRETGCGEITDRNSISGGSINSAYRVTTSDNHRYFIKVHGGDQRDMFEAEADGLNELADAHAIRVPRPIASGYDAGQSWLASEYIRFGSQRSGSVHRLGEQMAGLHRSTSDAFGWFRDNTIGSTPQQNGRMNDWIEFYRERRLRFQFELAARNRFRGSLQRKGERLMDGMQAFFERYSPLPSLLHGDLWGGNRAFDEHGNPVVFDPAVYYGDREADIAMTELFGGFGEAFYAAYNATWPLDEGYAVRKTLYNLYHILNHANLFGGGYASQAESMTDRLLAEIG